MATKINSKLKLSEIVFYVCSVLIVFSIFMFFMENLRWNPEPYKNIACPNFFDLMFGNYGSAYVGNWPVVGGMVVLFIFQLILSITCFVVAGLLFVKKISGHTAVCILCGAAVVALICGVLSLCSKVMIDRKSLDSFYFITDPSLKNRMALNYGAYVYGITMITAAVGSVGAFVLDHYNK